MELLFLIVVVLASVLISKLNSPSYKGKTGEKLVSERLEIIDGYKYIINNIMINDNGKSRQINHIAITEYGVFVIETKNFSGSIYGKENSNEWQQYLNHKCFKFKNPIHQNYGHLQIVKQHIEPITNEIFSVIAFIRKCKLNVDTKTLVIYEDQLVNYIRGKSKVLKKEQIDKIYQILIENRIQNEETIKNHNDNVKSYIKYKEDLVNNGICPNGCNNYPKCRYTKNI